MVYWDGQNIRMENELGMVHRNVVHQDRSGKQEYVSILSHFLLALVRAAPVVGYLSQHASIGHTQRFEKIIGQSSRKREAIEVIAEN